MADLFEWPSEIASGVMFRRLNALPNEERLWWLAEGCSLSLVDPGQRAAPRARFGAGFCRILGCVAKV